MNVAIEYDHDLVAAKLMKKRGWSQPKVSKKQVHQLRRALTQSSIYSSMVQSEVSGSVDSSCSESEDDESVGAVRRLSNQ